MDRKEILDRLSSNEISEEEAARRIDDLGKPLTGQLPPTQPPRKNNVGCLIVVLLLAFLGLVALALFALYFVRAA